MVGAEVTVAGAAAVAGVGATAAGAAEIVATAVIAEIAGNQALQILSQSGLLPSGARYWLFLTSSAVRLRELKIFERSKAFSKLAFRTKQTCVPACPGLRELKICEQLFSKLTFRAKPEMMYLPACKAPFS